MKERPVDLERAVVAHDQTPVVSQPADGALDDPAAATAPQGPANCNAQSPRFSVHLTTRHWAKLALRAKTTTSCP